ncbi:MAG: PASTA domain-containing protein [Methanosarcina sp.]
MTNISDLRSSLEVFRKAGTIDSSSYSSLVAKLNNTEVEFQSIQKEALAYKEKSEKLLLEKLALEQEKSSLVAQVTRLSNEKAELESRISILQKSRPVISSSNLVSSFASSLAEMDRGLKKVQSGPKYLVSSMNVTLKTNIALEGEELRFQMPKADDIISPENLSTIEFSLKAVPEKPGIGSYKEVPALVGLSKEEAENKLFEAGFKAGDILEKESSIPQGTVIAQLPSEGSLAEPGAYVDLTVSKISSVKVPDFAGLGLETAKTLIEKSRLRLEGVKEKPSDSTPGTVLAQSLTPGSETEVNSAIVLTVSVKVFKVPNLLGLELESAKQVIEKSGLQLGGVREQLSRGNPGIVLAQNPKPGLEVEANSKVDLIVSAGEKEIVLEKPVRSFPGTVVKEPANIVPAEPLPKPQPEIISKVSGDNSAGVPLANLHAETPIKISAETPVKTSSETQVQTRAETSVKFPAQVENSVESSVKPLNKGALSGETTPAGTILNTATPNSAPLNSASLNTAIPNSAPLNSASLNTAIPNTAPLNTAASLKVQTAVPPEPKPELVPDIIGMPLEKAVSLLGAQGLKVGTVSEVISTVAAGTVIKQNPGSGSAVNLSVPVSLAVSIPAPVTQLRTSTFSRLKL